MSISNEDINNNHVKTLSIRVSHLIGYINQLPAKDKKTLADVYPIEMPESSKDYIVDYLEHIKNDLLERP